MIKKISALFLAVILCFTFSACKNSGTQAAETVDSDFASIYSKIDEMLSRDIFNFEAENAVNISFEDGIARVDGDGATVDGQKITINKDGTYIFKGTADDGGIFVNCSGDVTLVLAGLNLTNKSGSAIYIYKSNSTVIYLSENTENYLTDAEKYDYSADKYSSVDSEPNACVYSKSDLKIAGQGKLIVNGQYNNGISGKDDLIIESSDITVNSIKHGVNGKDCLVIRSAKIMVNSGEDGIRSTNDTDDDMGFIALSNSKINITSSEDSIQATTVLYSISSDINAVSGNGSELVAAEKSAKGLKADGEVMINSGNYILDCSDDAVHSNKNVIINGGNFNISTADDAVHADENVSVSGGDIKIFKSYEGIEGKTVNISGGIIDIVSSDDGINASSGEQFEFGRGIGDSGAEINISGGIVKIDASGDGVDSNGSLSVSGGELYINGPVSSADSAIDFETSATVSGGVIVAVGASGMDENFTSATQGSILLNVSSSKEKITLKDSGGNLMLEFTPEKSYSSVLISSPDIKKGESYSVYCGEAENTVTLTDYIYGTSKFGGFGGDMGQNGRMDRPSDGSFGGQKPDGDFITEKPNDKKLPNDKNKPNGTLIPFGEEKYNQN